MESFFDYGLIGLFLASFLAATVIPLSSEAVFSYMLISDYSVYSVILLASVGNWLGGMSSFYLGYIGRWEWLEKYFRTDKEKVKNKLEWIRKYGSPVALLCWLPFVGDVIAVGLGFIRAKSFNVAIFMLVGKTVRYIIIAYVILYI